MLPFHRAKLPRHDGHRRLQTATLYKRGPERSSIFVKVLTAARDRCFRLSIQLDLANSAKRRSTRWGSGSTSGICFFLRSNSGPIRSCPGGRIVLKHQCRPLKSYRLPQQIIDQHGILHSSRSRSCSGCDLGQRSACLHPSLLVLFSKLAFT